MRQTHKKYRYSLETLDVELHEMWHPNGGWNLRVVSACLPVELWCLAFAVFICLHGDCRLSQTHAGGVNINIDDH